MPTTAARRAFIPWACKFFLAQDHEDADLLVVGDGELVADAVPEHPRVRYVHLVSPTRVPLGTKYNACVARARGPLVAIWADDDWPAPWKLSRLLEALGEKPAALIAGQRSMLFHRIGTGKTWLYAKPGDPAEAYFLGGSLLFYKRYWLDVRKFDERAIRAADAHFTNSLSADEYAEIAAVLPHDVALRQYVATIHPTNTGRPDADPSGPGWSRACENHVANLMGSAYDLWQPGGAICDRIGACE
jgi:hypothetical protein